MDLLLIRHAIAEPRIDEGGAQPEDALRELTGKGRRRMQRVARALRRIRPDIEVLATSPFVRAAETAKILAAGYQNLKPISIPEIQPGAGVDAMLAWLRGLDTSGTVVVVGHEPDLSNLASRLLSERHDGVLSLGKAGACLLEVPAGVPPAGATLVWLLTPRQLRWLGR
ncbi:MAG: histidine phosphatase family protein [Gemmatimonadetes bacterium]|nr:histidine phosphatase family protein [Gemmatimonadota bacterium]